MNRISFHALLDSGESSYFKRGWYMVYSTESLISHCVLLKNELRLRLRSLSGDDRYYILMVMPLSQLSSLMLNKQTNVCEFSIYYVVEWFLEI